MVTPKSVATKSEQSGAALNASRHGGSPAVSNPPPHIWPHYKSNPLWPDPPIPGALLLPQCYDPCPRQTRHCNCRSCSWSSWQRSQIAPCCVPASYIAGYTPYPMRLPPPAGKCSASQAHDMPTRSPAHIYKQLGSQSMQTASSQTLPWVRSHTAVVSTPDCLCKTPRET